MWKAIPELTKTPEKIESKVWWMTIRKYFQRYKNEHDFTTKVNMIFYFTALIFPTFLSLHYRYDFSS